MDKEQQQQNKAKRHERIPESQNKAQHGQKTLITKKNPTFAERLTYIPTNNLKQQT